MKISLNSGSSSTQTRSPFAARARRWIWGASALLLVIVILVLTRSHLLVLGRGFHKDLRSISVLQVVLGVLAIYAGVVLRAVRWALLMTPESRPSARTLIAPQFVGFAAVAIFGRVADLSRPYLVARRTSTPVTMQIGVYSIERAFDLAATAVLFSVTLLFVPRTAPHHEAFTRAGILASAATAFLLGLALLLRFAGQRIAHAVRTRAPKLAPKLANQIADRVLELQAGFSTLRSFAQFAGAFLLSMLIWAGIAYSYLFVAHSLPAVPQLAHLGLPAILLLMATSMGASLLQLPIAGWLTQIAAIAAAYHAFFGVPPGAASLCSILTLAVNTLSMIPPGLVMARRTGLSLREGHRSARTSARAA